jgi:hypothetical protein
VFSDSKPFIKNELLTVVRPIAGRCSRENVREAAKLGRLATHKPEAQARRGDTQRRQAAALKAWNPKDKPDWLDEVAYKSRVHPKLANCSISTIAMTLGVSLPYASDIRAGRNRPHPRHWLNLAQLVDILPDK